MAKGKVDIDLDIEHDKVIGGIQWNVCCVCIFFSTIESHFAGKVMHQDQRRTVQREKELNELVS